MTMPCGKTYNKLMVKVKKEYPNYGLERRKKIVGGIIYRNKKE